MTVWLRPCRVSTRQEQHQYLPVRTFFPTGVRAGGETGTLQFGGCFHGGHVRCFPLVGLDLAVPEANDPFGSGADVAVSVAGTVASTAVAGSSDPCGDAVASLTTVVPPQPARASVARRSMMPKSLCLANVDTQNVQPIVIVHLSALYASGLRAASALLVQEWWDIRSRWEASAVSRMPGRSRPPVL